MIPVSNINIASYLASKNFEIESSESVNGLITFYFPNEAEGLISVWENNPDNEMRMVQRFSSQKERLFQVIKASRSRSDYGNYR